jgi:hypothetical protein
MPSERWTNPDGREYDDATTAWARLVEMWTEQRGTIARLTAENEAMLREAENAESGKGVATTGMLRIRRDTALTRAAKAEAERDAMVEAVYPLGHVCHDNGGKVQSWSRLLCSQCRGVDPGMTPDDAKHIASAAYAERSALRDRVVSLAKVVEAAREHADGLQRSFYEEETTEAVWRQIEHHANAIRAALSALDADGEEKP